MPKDGGQVIVAANGSIYTAPLGTAEPTNIASALDAAFVELGYASPDGVTLATPMTIEEIRVWQSLYPVRRIVTERDFTAAFQLAQWNRNTVSFFFGGGTFSGSGGSAGYRFDPPAPEVIQERMLAIEWVDTIAGVEANFRIVVTKGMVVATDTSQMQRANAMWLPATFGAQGTSPTTQPWYLQTDFGGFAP